MQRYSHLLGRTNFKEITNFKSLYVSMYKNDTMIILQTHVKIIGTKSWIVALTQNLG